MLVKLLGAVAIVIAAVMVYMIISGFRTGDFKTAIVTIVFLVLFLCVMGYSLMSIYMATM